MSKLLIIQARMGSTRAPGKVLHSVLGKPYLHHMIDRLRLANNYDQLVVATSLSSVDDEIANFCILNNINVFRGSENDVISRYLACAEKYCADSVIRITADCPLIVPGLVDIVSSRLDGYDYSSLNTPPQSRSFPDGCDVECFTLSALQRADREVQSAKYREHLTFQFWQDNSYSSVQYIDYSQDLSGYRITVDYPEDITVVDAIFNYLSVSGLEGTLPEIIKFLDDNPEIASLNSRYVFGQGW